MTRGNPADTSEAGATVPGLVTVAVPARDEERSILALLDGIRAQTHRDLQILVVDGRSSDRTREIVAEVAASDPRVELVDNPGRVIPAALNVALERARGEYFVRVDAHCRVQPDYVERVVDHLRSGRWGGVGGRKDGRGVTSQGRAIAVAMGSRFAQGNSVYHYGTSPSMVDHVPFGAYPTALVRELAGWNPDQLVNEDYEFDYRVRSAGHELLFDPGIRIDWECRQSIRALFRQYRRYGSGKVQTLVRHPGSVGLRHLAAPGLVAGLGASVALLTARRTRSAGAAAIGSYSALVLAASTLTAAKLDDRGDAVWLPGVFAAMHLGWGTGFWEEVLATALGRGGPRRSLESS